MLVCVTSFLFSVLLLLLLTIKIVCVLHIGTRTASHIADSQHLISCGATLSRRALPLRLSTHARPRMPANAAAPNRAANEEKKFTHSTSHQEAHTHKSRSTKQMLSSTASGFSPNRTGVRFDSLNDGRPQEIAACENQSSGWRPSDAPDATATIHIACWASRNSRIASSSSALDRSKSIPQANAQAIVVIRVNVRPTVRAVATKLERITATVTAKTTFA